MYNSFIPDSSSVVQKVDYTYDTRGMLTQINEPDLPYNAGGIVYDPEGGVTATSDNDHFGQKITYYEDPNGYYNGRIYKNKTINSNSPGQSTLHDYEYLYNDLGWLTTAEHINDLSVNREFAYNAIGVRDSMYDAATAITTFYDYDFTGHPGSSKLLRTSEMGTNPDISYDAAGNIVADSSRIITDQSYDYRNMLTYSKLDQAAGGVPNSYLKFLYDERGIRIRKLFTYFWWDPCGGGGIPLNTLGGGGSMSSFGGSEPLGGGGPMGPGGGEQCVFTSHTISSYLYDNGKLVATFDKSDNVEDLFINGSGGVEASYWKNDDAKLHYYLKDNLGSTRVVMHSRENNIPIAVQATNYHSYGEVIDSWTSISNQFKFTGKENDNHSTFDFTYFGARYYDTKHGRFTTLDRAAEFANGYSYVGNNPISLVDPDGNAIAPIIAFTGKLWSYYMTAKTAYYTAKSIHAFLKNPSYNGFFDLMASNAQGIMMNKIGGSEVATGIVVVSDAAMNDRWPARDQYISYGLAIAQYGAASWDASRAAKADATYVQLPQQTTTSATIGDGTSQTTTAATLEDLQLLEKDGLIENLVANKTITYHNVTMDLLKMPAGEQITSGFNIGEEWTTYYIYEELTYSYTQTIIDATYTYTDLGVDTYGLVSKHSGFFHSREVSSYGLLSTRKIHVKVPWSTFSGSGNDYSKANRDLYNGFYTGLRNSIRRTNQPFRDFFYIHESPYGRQ